MAHRIRIAKQDDGEDKGCKIVVNHDPVPLLRQFKAHLAGRYSWNYARKDPHTWQVEICRVPTIVCAAAANMLRKRR